MVVWMLEDMLTDLGFEMVGPAVRVGEALELVDAEVFDAAVVDINLAGTQSFPVADALAARGIPFTFATGYDRSSLPSEYQRFSCLRKPYRISDLREALDQIMEGRTGNTV
ncbi:MAG: chemotaxis protein CheY [Rhodospirillales bacterium]|jgi:CheY-like chemotaxis protein|nr:chemotaxis protein CheY [Rhodospirillales bacterium]MDB5383918.1 chemotaxis protein CheY [Rhodospirillales bacterium]